MQINELEPIEEIKETILKEPVDEGKAGRGIVFDLNKELQLLKNSLHLFEIEVNKDVDLMSSVNQLNTNIKPYSFSEPMSLLSDIKFKSEFESLFPGYWDRFINGQLRMSKDNKEMRLEFAELRINKMPDFMRLKYRKLYAIVKFLLLNIADCKFSENESLDLGLTIDKLFKVRIEATPQQTINLFTDLEIESGEMLEFNLNFL